MSILASMTAEFAFLAGVVLLILIAIRRWFRYYGPRRKKGQSQPILHIARIEPKPLEPLRDAPPELSRWQVDMHATARELKAELDSKIGVLQTLLGMARQEIQHLESAMLRSGRTADDRSVAPERDPPSSPLN